MGIAVSAAVAAGACFALAGVLQQQAASASPAEEAMSLRLLLRLARRPQWLAGIMLAVLAYGFQALALAFGPLSLVQPLIVSELVFAIPLAARLHRMRLRAREWLGAGCVTGGLATALVAARPQGGNAQAEAHGWTLVLTSVCVLTAVVLLAGQLARGAARASLIAVAGGVVMGFQSVLLAVVVEKFPDGPAAVFTAWQTYLLIAASVYGLLLIQTAFQAGPISASMPAIDAAEPAVAISAGVALFGETVRTSAPAVAAAGSGVALMAAGIFLLDTSPLLAALHRRESGEPPALPRAPRVRHHRSTRRTRRAAWRRAAGRGRGPGR